jgi:hypothetical protein
MITDPILVRIGRVWRCTMAAAGGIAARELFAQVWEETGGEQGDPLHVCVPALDG